MPIAPIIDESKNSRAVDHKDTDESTNVLYMQVQTMSGIVKFFDICNGTWFQCLLSIYQVRTLKFLSKSTLRLNQTETN